MERALRIVWPAGAVAGLALVAWWPVNSRVAAAQLFAVAGTLLVTRLLFATGRERPVALRPFTYGDDQKVEAAGLEVPAEALSDEQVQKGVDYELQRGLFFRGLFLGKDGRWSTSKLQVLLWTYAVVFALSSIFLAAALGVDEGLDSLIDIDDEHWDIYLLLLGGPFAAMVLARGITETKVENETVAKTQSEPTTNVGQGLSEVISNDAGETDIVDFQYFVFNLLALAYFLGSFVPDLRNGLPELPELLVALTGASAATYVTKKAIEREKPSITALLPSKARAGRDIEIWGHSLLLGERSSESRKPRISIGSAEVPDSDLLILGDAASGVDHLRCTVPRTAELGAGTLRIVTVAGVCAEAPLEIESGVRVRAVTPGKVKIASPAEITIVGGGFGAPDTQGVVLLDGVTLATQAWAEDVIRVTLADPGAYAPNQQAQLMVQDGAGQRSEPWILGVE